MIKVQVITSNDIENKESLERWATEYLSEHLARFEQDVIPRAGRAPDHS